jgi:hypothetical protein
VLPELNEVAENRPAERVTKSVRTSSRRSDLDRMWCRPPASRRDTGVTVTTEAPGHVQHYRGTAAFNCKVQQQTKEPLKVHLNVDSKKLSIGSPPLAGASLTNRRSPSAQVEGSLGIRRAGSATKGSRSREGSASRSIGSPPLAGASSEARSFGFSAFGLESSGRRPSSPVRVAGFGPAPGRRGGLTEGRSKVSGLGSGHLDRSVARGETLDRLSTSRRSSE